MSTKTCVTGNNVMLHKALDSTSTQLPFQGFMQDKSIASHMYVLVDTGHMMLTVKLVYKLSNVSDDLKWATNTHMTPFTFTFKAN